MQAKRLEDALQKLVDAAREVESAIAAMKAERDPLASHIFISRRQYQTVNDTKAGSGVRWRHGLVITRRASAGFRAAWLSGSG